MHSANKKISMIRSKSMERFSKKQELIVVTPRIKTVEAEQAEQFSGPFIGQAIAVTDFTPNPYDREALRLRRGDIIDVIETNPNGTWRGHCRGRVGNFKFLNVETIPNGRMRLSSISIQGDPQCREDRGAKTRSVHQLLASVNMTQYLSVLTLNGFDNIDSLYKLDKATLDYFGIVNPVQQSQLLGAIQVDNNKVNLISYKDQTRFYIRIFSMLKVSRSETQVVTAASALRPALSPDVTRRGRRRRRGRGGGWPGAGAAGPSGSTTP